MPATSTSDRSSAMSRALAIASRRSSTTNGSAPAARTPIGHRLGDFRRVFRARVVRGHDRNVSRLTDRKTHWPALALVTIASGAENDDQAPVGDPAQGLQNRAQAVGGVGVVDKHRERRIDWDPFHAAGQRPCVFEAAPDGAGAEAGSVCRGRCGERVAQIVNPNQWQVDRDLLVSQPENESAAVEIAGDVSGTDRSAFEAPGDVAIPGLVEQTRSPRVVDRQHTAAVSRQVFGEEPPLGLEVGLHVVVVIEVIAGQVGPHRNVELESRQPILAEGVGRDLHRHRSCALGHRPLQHRRQIGGLRRRPLAGHFHTARDTRAEGADECGRSASRVQDQADEVGGRALAVGPGHRQHLQLLLWISGQDPRRPRHQRPRVSAFDPGNVEVLSRSAVGENRRCTAGQRLFEVVDAVGVLTREGRKDKTRPHLPRVVGDASHLAPRIAGQLALAEALEEGLELHALSPSAAVSPWAMTCSGSATGSVGARSRRQAAASAISAKIGAATVDAQKSISVGSSTATTTDNPRVWHRHQARKPGDVMVVVKAAADRSLGGPGLAGSPIARHRRQPTRTVTNHSFEHVAAAGEPGPHPGSAFVLPRRLWFQTLSPS